MRIKKTLLASVLLVYGLKVAAQGNIAVGDAHYGADSVRTASFNVGLIGHLDSLRGFQFNLLSSHVNRSASGVNLGGLSTITLGDVRGLQLSSMVNTVGGTLHGVQIAGMTNIAQNMNGVQIGGLGNITFSPFKGLQLATITNIAMGVKKGIQISAFANVGGSYMRGLQIGGYNYTDTLSGSQIGLLNVALSHPRGWQVGIINYTRDTVAHKIGLINVNPNTNIDILTYLGTTSVFNAAVRFRNRSTYNIIGFGTHYMGLDERFSGALFYRIGQYFTVAPRWTLSGDLGFYHIETFEQNSTNKPERLYSLQGHVNVDYQINPTLGVFASVGYGDTRYYGHHRKYKNGLLGQVGISISWHRRGQRNRADEMGIRNQVDDGLYHTPALDSLAERYAWNNPVNQQKHYWKAAAEATGINVLVHCFDRFVLNEDFAQVHFKDIARNWRDAFVWDNDQFSTNLFAHPYHGNLYFNSARSSGLNFWESAPYALGGSLMWEFCGEVEPPAINDLLATTFGGIAIGEVMHRISALVLNDRSRGFRRFLREAASTIINPMQGFNRIISGDAWRVRDKYYLYHDFSRIPIDFSISLGMRYLADDGGLFRGEYNPYLNFFLEYGDPFNEEERQPYDFFYAEATFGLSGNQPLINGLHLLGRLWSMPVYAGKNMRTLFGIFQHFNYYDSKPVKNGTSLTPYRISEAASFGPGVIMELPQFGVMSRLEQRIFISGILLGGTKSDFYNVIDRDYNMGSGFSVKTKTHMEIRHFGRFILHTDYYRIYTWKGYEGKDLETVNPLYLNAQGDKGNAGLLVINSMWELDFRGPLSAVLSSSYYMRDTHYAYHPDVHAQTFEVRVGLTYHF